MKTLSLSLLAAITQKDTKITQSPDLWKILHMHKWLKLGVLSAIASLLTVMAGMMLKCHYARMVYIVKTLHSQCTCHTYVNDVVHQFLWPLQLSLLCTLAVVWLYFVRKSWPLPGFATLIMHLVSVGMYRCLYIVVAQHTQGGILFMLYRGRCGDETTVTAAKLYYVTML